MPSSVTWEAEESNGNAGDLDAWVRKGQLVGWQLPNQDRSPAMRAVADVQPSSPVLPMSISETWLRRARLASECLGYAPTRWTYELPEFLTRDARLSEGTTASGKHVHRNPHFMRISSPVHWSMIYASLFSFSIGRVIRGSGCD
jgi:hypothetical protein